MNIVDGSIKTVRAGGSLLVKLGDKRIGLSGIIRGLKVKRTGVGLEKIALSLVSARIDNPCSVLQVLEDLKTNSSTPMELGLDPADLSAGSFYRGLGLLGSHADQIYSKAVDSFSKIVDVDFSCVFMDWSSVVLYGDCCELAKRGFSKDKRPDKKQLKIGVAVANGSSIAFHYSVEEGNLLDLEQFQKDFEKIQDRIPVGSLIVFDKGANTAENLKRVTEKHDYLTAVKNCGSLREKIRSLDKTSMKHVLTYEAGEKAYSFREEINGVYRYFFYDQKREKDDQAHRKKEVDKVLEEKKELEKILREKGIKALKRKTTTKKNQVKELGSVIVKTEVTIQKRLIRKTNKEITEQLSQDQYLDGFFVLESSRKMKPSKALEAYRKKDQVEKLISELKTSIEIKPLRVWNKDRVKGVMLISLLAHLFIGLLQHISGCMSNTKRTILEKLKNLTLVFKTGRKGVIIEKKYANLNSLTIKLLNLSPG